MSNDIFINFVKHLPALEEIVAGEGSKVNINGIKKALEYGQHLSVLIVNTVTIC